MEWLTRLFKRDPASSPAATEPSGDAMQDLVPFVLGLLSAEDEAQDAITALGIIGGVHPHLREHIAMGVTGLLTHRDEQVRIRAVRVVRGLSEHAESRDYLLTNAAPHLLRNREKAAARCEADIVARRGGPLSPGEVPALKNDME